MAFVLMVGDSRVLRWREERFKLDLPVSVHSLPSPNLDKIQDRVRDVLCGRINPNRYLYPIHARPHPKKSINTKKMISCRRVKSSYEDCIDSFMSSLAQSNPLCARLEDASEPFEDHTQSDCPPNNDNIKAIIVVGFLYDFLVRTADATTKSGKGLTKVMPATCTKHYSGLLAKVVSTTREWQEKVASDCKIVWTLPYPFDFLQYNSLFLVKVQQDPLSSREEYSFQRDTKLFMYKLMVLRRLWLNLVMPDVIFFDLNLLDDTADELECNRMKCPRYVTPGYLFPSPKRVKTFNVFLNRLLQEDGPPHAKASEEPKTKLSSDSQFNLEVLLTPAHKNFMQ